MYRMTSLGAALSAFFALLLFPEAARSGAAAGLEMCARLIIPSLFPFFVASMLLSELGFAELGGRLFGNGRLSTAFLVGISGGYPLGAAYAAQLYKRGGISRVDAEKMLVCCNNSGPAFILGAVGSGVFHSVCAGLFLYAVHILAALIAAVILSPSCGGSSAVSGAPGFSEAFTRSVSRSVTACLSVCGFIVAFSVLVGIIDSSGAISLAAGRLSALFGLEPHFCRALLLGVLELGNAVSAMNGLAVSPANLALAALILGWGGISVHFQTFSVISDTELKAARYIIGRLLTSILACIMAYFGAYVVF